SWGPQVGTYVAGTPYRIAIIARAAGAFFLISGGSYSQWTMIWLDNVSVVNLSPEVWNESAVFSASNLRVLDLPSFSSDDKVYTSRLVSPGIGATATMTPNAWVEINATVPPSGSKYLNVKVRVVDAANYVNIGLDNVGTTIGVSEYVGGVPTWLGGFTVTPSGPSRFVVVLTNAEVKLYLNDAYLGAITSPNFVSAGGLVVGDCAFVVDSIISWPRYPAFPSGV
ncbi:MAG TPA: hypothetical protein PK435_16065, partial [Thermoanaerobaculaceae bacterium]|nr:hypothetical protein [Thermoanaerobaculaceae bacterium]